MENRIVVAGSWGQGDGELLFNENRTLCQTQHKALLGRIG
jgi:hypothetical protein